MMKNYLTIDETREMFCHVARQMMAGESILEELDNKIGDGDHGRNMKRGFSQVLTELPRMHYTCVEDVFLSVGTILVDVTGGASGVLFGTMFVSGVVKRGKNFSLSLEDVSQIFRVSLDAICVRSRSKPGDKTMIDALEPAVRELEKSVEEDSDIPGGFRRAAQGAAKGAEGTRLLEAKHGRARYFEGKGVGVPDPGAVSVRMIFEAMSEWAASKDWSEDAEDMQVITLTLNPCQDRTIDISSMQYGGTNKVLEVRTDVSGKGINVSCVLKRLGIRTRCLGFNYSMGYEIIGKFLNDQGIPYDFVKVPGLLRTNVKVFEKETGIMTEFNEAGLSVPKEALGQLMERIRVNAEHTRILTLSGSLPAGVPENTYRRIIEETNLMGCRTILDTSGQALREGIKAVPFMIKPNIEELRNAFRPELEGGKDIGGLVKELLDTGIRYICLSFGKSGAYLISRDNILFAEPLKVTVRGVQGAGDSMAAAMCAAILEDLPDEKILAYGMAAAGASLEHSGTQLCSAEDFRRLLPQVRVCRVDRICDDPV